VKIRFLGSGDAFGSGGRFNTCFLVEADSGSFLIDCGASAMIAMRRFAVDPNAISTVFLSHLHGDHFGGLPFLILDAQPYSRRTEPLTIAGPPGTEARLAQAMEVFFPGSTDARRKFETRVVELTAGVPAEVDGVTVTPFEVDHACGAPPFALRLEVAGKVVAYSGDTEWTENLIEAGRGADLLIAEALFFERRIRYHLDYASLAEHLGEIGAKRVILTHMALDMLARRHEVPLDCARDGMVVDI
jgi:ribonuclease BN (tRNA processing enzyme)